MTVRQRVSQSGICDSQGEDFTNQYPVMTDKEALITCVLTAQARVDLVREALRKEGNSWLASKVWADSNKASSKYP